MRVAVLNDGSGIGRRVARDLGEHPDVGRVDLIEGDELSVGTHSSGQPVSPVASLISGADVAVACLGGDGGLEQAAAAAAIDQGIPYISSCDGVEAFESLQSLDEKARVAQVLLLAGLGFSPGISNVLARAGADAMDEVNTVHIAWVISAGGEAGGAALRTAMRALSGPAVLFEDGAWHRSSAGTFAERVYFPEPVGWRRVHICEGVEALSLPGTLSGVSQVSVRGAVTEGGVDRMARKVSELGALSSSARRDHLISVARPMLPWIGRLSGRRRSWSALRVDVKGISAGKPKAITLGVMDQYANLVSGPLVAAALMVARGEIKGVGALSAESLVVANDFFSALAERGVRVARLER